MPAGDHHKRRGRTFPPRRVIFIGCEGASERAFVALLQRYCADAGHDVHLKTWVGSGGDSLAVVDGMVRHLRRVPFKREIETKLILLDEDRMASDRKSGRDARATARSADIDLVGLLPNSEGLLLRLHPGHEQRKVPANQTERELRKLWPDYKKPPNANDLNKRFSVDDLRRASRYPSAASDVLKALVAKWGEPNVSDNVDPPELPIDLQGVFESVASGTYLWTKDDSTIVLSAASSEMSLMFVHHMLARVANQRLDDLLRGTKNPI